MFAPLTSHLFSYHIFPVQLLFVDPLYRYELHFQTTLEQFRCVLEELWFRNSNGFKHVFVGKYGK